MLKIRNTQIFHYSTFSHKKLRELIDFSVCRIHVIAAHSVNIDRVTRFLSRRNIPRQLRPIYVYIGHDLNNQKLYGTFESDNTNLKKLLEMRPQMITTSIPHTRNFRD